MVDYTGVLKELKNYQKQVKEGSPASYSLYIGMCDPVGIIIDNCIIREEQLEAKEYVYSIILSWPKALAPQFNELGDDYVVPASNFDNSLSSARKAYAATPFKYDKTTEYGRLRIELLDYLVEQLELKVNS